VVVCIGKLVVCRSVGRSVGIRLGRQASFMREDRTTREGPSTE
jgi:hypothetical protein